MGPGNSLRLTGGAGGEQDRGGRVRIARKWIEGVVVAEKLLPAQVGAAAHRRRAGALRQHDCRRRVRFHHLGVQGQQLAVAQDPVLGEDRPGSRDPQADGDLLGGEAVGDAHRGAAGEDDPEIDGHRLRGHRQVQRDGVAGTAAGGAQPVGDAVGQCPQRAVAEALPRAALGLVYDRHRVCRRVEAALRDVQPAAREPARLPQVGEIGDRVTGMGEADPQPLRQVAPERRALRHRPIEQFRIRGAAPLPHQRVQVAGAGLLVRGDPGRCRAEGRVAGAVGALVEELVYREGGLGRKHGTRQFPPAALRRPLAVPGRGEQVVRTLRDAESLRPVESGGEQILQQILIWNLLGRGCADNGLPAQRYAPAIPTGVGRSGPWRRPPG